MKKPYLYRLRPGYGSDKLLLEFRLASSDAEFDQALWTALQEISPAVDFVEDLWMNDEVLLRVSSTEGGFLLSKDVWGFAFIMAEENQSYLARINDMLTSSNLFEKKAYAVKLGSFAGVGAG